MPIKNSSKGKFTRETSGDSLFGSARMGISRTKQHAIREDSDNGTSRNGRVSAEGSVSDGPVQDQVITKQYSLFNGDCCEVLPELPSKSIGLVIYSPPFADLFAYSDTDHDMGNCRSYDEFFEHYEFLVRQIHRVMLPGRITAVHCMDLPTFKNKGEEIGIRDFPGDIVRLHEKCGFTYASRFCIWKDPLIAATRTKAIGLAHKQIVKDSAMCRTGIPDYILSFRKSGDNPKPIAHPMGLVEYYGARAIPSELSRYEDWEEQKTNKRSQWIWQKYASPVWDDIRQGKVLQYKKAKEADDEKHVCCLQTDVINRCLVLWSAEDDIILDPFDGVGSTVYCAVKMGRKGVGIELKRSYHRQAVKNLESLIAKQHVKGLM